jgi:hypothetical protein
MYRILHHRFTELYEEILGTIALPDYRLDDIEKKIYSIGGRKYFDDFVYSLMANPIKILPDQYLREDIKKYRGAGYAYMNAVYSRVFSNNLRDTYSDHQEIQTHIITKEEFDWRQYLFVGEGQISRGSNRFLDSCPGQIPLDYKLYWNTSRNPSRLYYVAHNTLVDMRRRELSDSDIAILERSTDDQLKKALKIVGCTNFRRVQSLINWFSHIFIIPSPNTKNCTIVGWARHAMREHEREEALALEKKLERLKNKNLVAPKFPVDLTQFGLRQLITPEEIVTEGHEMKHCVGGYVSRVMDGASFIFALEYNNERATIELNREGDLVQAQGIRNCQNSATAYAYGQVKKHLDKIKKERAATALP